MNPLRRVGTPESEAVASSEDEKPWPSSTSFGSLPRKENGMPGLGGGIWGHGTQKRGSFKLPEAAQRNAARDVRLGVSSLRTANTPSPSVSEGVSGSLPFAIPLQPTPKIHRSLSHSQGQRESPQTPGGLAGQGAGALPLGLLAEDNETDADSDIGEQLTHTVSQPPIGALQRSATYSAAYGLPSGAENGRDHSGDRLQAALSQLTLEPQQRRSQWESHLGWSDLPNINESRRHSLADIPTRRGSLSDEGYGANSFSHLHARRSVLPPSGLGPNSREHGRDHALQTIQDHSMRASDGGERFTIPDMYKVPFVSIGPDELSPDDVRRIRQLAESAASSARFPGPSSGIRPRKLLFVVSFKCSRVEIFFLLEGTGLNIREGDIVIVEADRGQDLGTVQHANVTPDQARLYKRKYAEEQYKWLMMFSINNAPSNVNPNAQLYGENTSRSLLNNAPSTMQGMPRENFNNLKPKAIKRLANAHEIRMLAEKEGNEAKAKRTCQQKVAHLHLQMEILDAEWQWDFQKLIFYYYADHYINFKDLITELYRIYKTRIWLSAVNPASFSQHAMGQPPSGIGPGAITPYNNGGLNNTYTMAYGADPDPYGAVPPYRVGYDTYDPNYPSIPGMPNSFAPGAPGNSLTPTAAAFQPATDPNNSAPTAPPGSIQTGTITDYNYFYDRNNDKDKMLSPTSAGGMSAGTPQNQFMNQYWQYAGPVGSPTLEMPGRPNFRNFSPSPWSNTAAATTGAPGIPARQAEVQLPIGTRPKSNGGNNNGGGVPLPDYMRPASNNQAPFSINQASFSSNQPSFMNQTRYGAGSNRGNAGQAEASSSSQTGNWPGKQSSADEISRER